MADRAQLTTPRLAPALFVAVAVLAVVAAEVRDAVAAVDGPVEYCGLCHVPVWKELVAILLLVGVAALLISPVRRVPEEDSDE